MPAKMMDDAKLKNLMKSAFGEALEENRELVGEIVGEAIEEIALARAVEQGLKTKPIPRAQVFSLLEGKR